MRMLPKSFQSTSARRAAVATALCALGLVGRPARAAAQHEGHGRGAGGGPRPPSR